MNKAYVLAMVMIIFNLVLIWFNAMELFSYQPSGLGTLDEQVAGYPSAYSFDNIAFEGFIFVALTALLGIVIAKLFRINAFSLILFINIFWLPYLVTIKIFDSVLGDTPIAFQGIIIIFTSIMVFIFAYALIEMSNSTVVSG